MSFSQKDRKISSIELEEKGLTVGDREIIPPLRQSTQAGLRSKRVLPYSKIGGRVWYQQSELVTWAEGQKVEVRAMR
jgi:hypothetical protein